MNTNETCEVMNPLSNYLPERILRLVSVASWLLVAATVQADDAVPLSVKVISVAGSARYWHNSIAKGSWKAVRVGDELRAGSVLQTESKDSTTTDVELVGPDAHGWGKVRMYSNCVLKLLRLDLKKPGSGQASDVRIDVPVGKIRVSLDGDSDYVFALNPDSTPMRLTVARSVVGSKETVFLAAAGSLTVLKGAVTASFGSGPEKLVRAGEQLRSDVNEVTKLPPDAPELKLGQ
jgi:hypothetical protein